MGGLHIAHLNFIFMLIFMSRRIKHLEKLLSKTQRELFLCKKRCADLEKRIPKDQHPKHPLTQVIQCSDCGTMAAASPDEDLSKIGGCPKCGSTIFRKL